ncbi:MAG: hypothetical protein RMJ43_13315 [Chloroherpetonaceae bacterium]|nr:hypothetical protein [Chloroherpetonaceae bacterium]
MKWFTGMRKLHALFYRINRPLDPAEQVHVLEYDLGVTEEGDPVPLTDPRCAYSIGRAGTPIPRDAAVILGLVERRDREAGEPVGVPPRRKRGRPRKVPVEG